MGISETLTLNLRTEVDGRTWRLFDVRFETVDGRQYSFYIYALSREHASYIVADIKRTAALAPGELLGFDRDGGCDD